MDSEILSAILENEGKPKVLATIIDKKGSSPRGVGTKMLVLEDGSIVGTVGGGSLEAEVIEASKKVFKTGIPLSLEFNMTSKDAEKAGMICGGTAKVFLEKI